MYHKIVLSIVDNRTVSVELHSTNDIRNKDLKGSLSNYNTPLFWYPKAKKEFRYSDPSINDNDVNEARILTVLSNRPTRSRCPRNVSL